MNHSIFAAVQDQQQNVYINVTSVVIDLDMWDLRSYNK